MPGQPLVWDACDLLCLVASNRASEILVALGCPCFVVREVLAGETLWLRLLPEEAGQPSLIRGDLSDLLQDGLLHEITMTQPEALLMVEYAEVLDDGEARTAAAAFTRGWLVATSDRAAVRLLRSLEPPPPVLTAVDWVKQWSEAVSADPGAVAEVIRRIELRSRWRPPRAHPLAAWWGRSGYGGSARSTKSDGEL